MGEVVQYQQPQAIAPVFSMSDMERVALAIAKGGLFGSTDPNAVLTLCMLAQAEGQHPAVVFRDYHIISGKPAKKAEAMQRDFLAAGGRIQWVKLDDEECEATFSHPQGGTATISWDKARVAQAQLGGNAMHKKYPRQMLRSRVISEGVRTVFPSATSGLYEAGEVQDMVAQDRPSAPQAQRARDMAPVAALPDENNTGRAKAEEWLANQVASVASAADVDALDAVIAGGHKAVAKLAREHGDLHQQIQDAYEARAAALNGYGAASAFTDLLTRIEAATLIADVMAIEASYQQARAMFEVAEQDQIEAAIDAAKAKMKGGK
ncbi:MAG: hypothetical protein ACKVOB_13330 [Sphingomonas sp.]